MPDVAAGEAAGAAASRSGLRSCLMSCGTRRFNQSLPACFITFTLKSN